MDDYEGRRRDMPAPRDRRDTAMWDHCPLTQKQIAVIQLVAEGLSYENIAKELGISTRKTCIEHVQRARRRLGLIERHRTPAALIVAICMREGWID